MYSEKLIKATLTLFNCVPIVFKRKKTLTKQVMDKCLRNGVVISPEVNYNYKELDFIFNISGITPEEMNSTFHKSWGKIAKEPLEKLFLEQLIHYLTTYGFEELGLYNESFIYIPDEKLDIPDIKDNRTFLKVVNGLELVELKERILNLISTPIALSKESLEAIETIISEIKMDEKEILEKAKNKEVKMYLYDRLDKLPKEPEEFIRFVIYKATGKTLLIKNKETIEAIKGYNSNEIIKNYIISFGYPKLASVFNRFKPIILAMKNKETSYIINKLSKWSKKVHKPLEEDYLNSITSKIKNGIDIDNNILKDELDNIPVFRKIKLLYAIKYRMQKPESIVYNIRNGKGFATSIGELGNFNIYKNVYSKILDSIVQGISKNVKGKIIKINKEVKYGLPSSEKQFTGNVPYGTSISCDKDMLFGVYWKNQNYKSIDLDLSILNLDGKIGWDGLCRSSNSEILFSGDVVDATNGAAEMFYIKKQVEKLNLVCLNDYRLSGFPVEYKVVIGKKNLTGLEKNFMLDPNDVIATINSTIPNGFKTLGLVKTTSKKCSFYFYETEISRKRTSKTDDKSIKTIEYIKNMYINPIDFNELLQKAGATIVESGKCDLDLSIEAISKDSIIKILI